MVLELGESFFCYDIGRLMILFEYILATSGVLKKVCELL